MRSGGGGGGGDFALILLSCAKPGSFVKKGQVVAEFDRQYMLLRLDDYRASVATMALGVKKLRSDMLAAKAAHNQVLRVVKADLEQTLLDLKTVEVRSAIEAERFQLAANEARARMKQITQEAALFDASQQAQLRAAEIDLNQAQSELKRAEANVDRMVMKAPIDGLVVMQTMFRGGEFGQIREGDQIAPGMLFMSIVDPRSMVVNAVINQLDSESLRLNMKARVRVDAYSDLVLPATVIGLGAMTKPGGWRGTFVREIPVRLKLDAMDARVIPDLSASADIVVATERQAVVAPRAAIFQAEAGANPFVYLRGPAGWTRKEVEVGLVNNVAAAVRSGLRKGDVVAVERPLS
ncbi:MAG TPA: HlyD family efflux transporter periplasmic adaptor subunit [Bryobacteraceae bacterium]|nr:HlyD family efflux transporter periplasmic adaptor subunit [Bryobacteraceae bacterium]